MHKKYLLTAIKVILYSFAAAVISKIFVDIGKFKTFIPDMWIVIVMDAAVATVSALILKFNFSVKASAGFPEMIRITAIDFSVLAVNMVYDTFVDNLLNIKRFGLRYMVMYSAIFGVILCVDTFSYRFVIHMKEYFSRDEKKDRAIIIGAGEAGQLLAREMMASSGIKTVPVAFVDDDRSKKGLYIAGIEIAGGINMISKIAVAKKANKAIIAIPSASKSARRQIVEKCKAAGLDVLMVPGVADLINEKITFASVREVRIEDLLGRDQIKVNMTEITDHIKDKVVMVTGGGGSIGSELCRQIASFSPKTLIIFDIYENNAYDIQQELKKTVPDLDLVVLIGSIRDKGKLESVFEKYRPDIVFNAAAHKHVPLMEDSPNEAIKNNVFGTLNAARAAEKYGAERFIQISTDKAVNPTNIMGASKRICEMIVQTIGRHSEKTDFVAVRFGNVLGSNGSVIPLFKKQIAEGGPVTVTHKDIIRYFMTINEAVTLVLQAACYAKGGEIFVFDMGEPVKIYDLAYHLIELSGYTPNEDIEIVCTGLRPGEKLYEERLMAEEGLEKTANDLISVGKPIELNEKELWDGLDRLYEAAYSETDKIRGIVSELVPTYSPSSK